MTDVVELPSLVRYVGPKDRRTGHLLPRRWAEVKGKQGRPSHCGIWTRSWRGVHLLDDPTRVRDCPDCSTAIGIDVTVVRPLDIPPRAALRRIAGVAVPSVPAVPLDPQGAHARIPPDHRIRRGPWLPSIPQPGQLD